MTGESIGRDWDRERMEILRGISYDNLEAGGSLAANLSGFADSSDPELVVRWQIVENVSPANTKTVTVRVIAARQVVGQRKEITLTTIRGD